MEPFIERIMPHKAISIEFQINVWGERFIDRKVRFAYHITLNMMMGNSKFSEKAYKYYLFINKIYFKFWGGKSNVS